MIKSITLKNFQSHKESTLIFTEGLNTIRGASDSGKSAILRGFHLLINNKPSGDSYITHGQKRASVSAEIDNKTLTNERASGSNEYDLSGSVFKALAGKVPSEVSEFVNMDDINIQKQMDSPFLLSETPGEVAKTLNRIVNLSVIDVLNKNINSNHRLVNQELKFTKGQAEDLEVQLAKYDSLDEIGTKLEEIKKTEEDKKELSNKINKIDEMVDSMELLEVRQAPVANDIKEQEALLTKTESVIGIITESQELEEKAKKIEKIETELESIIARGKQTKLDIEEQEALLKKAEAVAGTIQEITELEEKADLIRSAIDKLEDLWYSMDKLNKEIDEKETELSELMGDRCPLCGK